MILCPFFIARRETSPLFEPIDQPLHPVAFPIDCPVERAGAPFILFARDRDADAVPPQIRPDLPAAVALVTDDPLRPQLGAASARPFDRPLLHQLLEGGRLVPLTRRQDEGDRLACALDADMHLGAEAAVAAPERLSFWVPFFAPAACWWARMTVAST